jgi:hypothetical protein
MDLSEIQEKIEMAKLHLANAFKVTPALSHSPYLQLAKSELIEVSELINIAIDKSHE